MGRQVKADEASELRSKRYDDWAEKPEPPVIALGAYACALVLLYLSSLINLMFGLSNTHVTIMLICQVCR